MNPRFLAEAREDLQTASLRAQQEQDRYRQSLYERIPHLWELDAQIRRTMLEGMTALLRTGADPVAAVNASARENLAAQAERTALLQKAGIDPKCLEPSPLCSKCGDRLETDGRLCACLRERAAVLQLQELEKKVDFARGIVKPTDEDGCLVWSDMEKYAEEFTPGARSHFFPDSREMKSVVYFVLRTVAQQGYWVEYESSSRLFSLLEAEKFDRLREEDGDPRRYFQCDLLVLDDLGTEYTTTFVKAALFDLLNTRLNERRTTLICSAVKRGALSTHYSPQVQARIQSRYLVASD